MHILQVYIFQGVLVLNFEENWRRARDKEMNSVTNYFFCPGRFTNCYFEYAVNILLLITTTSTTTNVLLLLLLATAYYYMYINTHIKKYHHLDIFPSYDTLMQMYIYVYPFFPGWGARWSHRHTH